MNRARFFKTLLGGAGVGLLAKNVSAKEIKDEIVKLYDIKKPAIIQTVNEVIGNNTNTLTVEIRKDYIGHCGINEVYDVGGVPSVITNVFGSDGRQWIILRSCSGKKIFYNKKGLTKIFKAFTD